MNVDIGRVVCIGWFINSRQNVLKNAKIIVWRKWRATNTWQKLEGLWPLIEGNHAWGHPQLDSFPAEGISLSMKDIFLMIYGSRTHSLGLLCGWKLRRKISERMGHRGKFPSSVCKYPSNPWTCMCRQDFQEPKGKNDSWRVGIAETRCENLPSARKTQFGVWLLQWMTVF